MEKDLLGGRKAGEKEPEGNSQRQQGGHPEQEREWQGEQPGQERGKDPLGEEQPKREKTDTKEKEDRKTGDRPKRTVRRQVKRRERQKSKDPMQEADVQDRDCQEQETSRLSEAEKTKIAVLEKRIQGIEKTIRKKQSAWLRWEQWEKGFLAICMVILFAIGVFLALFGMVEADVDFIFFGALSIAFSLNFLFCYTPMGEKIIFEDSIKKMEKNIKKIKEQIRQIKYPDDEKER